MTEDAGSRWHLGPARVLRVAAALIVVQLLVRTWVAANSDFYWDDLILAGRGGSLPLFSGDLLLYDHDGHLMPGRSWWRVSRPGSRRISGSCRC